MENKIAGSIKKTNQLQTSYHYSETVYFKNFTDLTSPEKEAVFHWRNHPEVCKWMYNANPLNLTDHLTYLNNLSNQCINFYWVAYENKNPIGVISLTKNKVEKFEWGFYLNPEFFGRSYSIRLVHYGLNFFFKKLKLKSLSGFVDCNNLNSLLLHYLFDIKHYAYVPISYKHPIRWYSHRTIDAENWMKKNYSIEEIKRKLITNKKGIQAYRTKILKEKNNLQKFGQPIKHLSSK